MRSSKRTPVLIDVLIVEDDAVTRMAVRQLLEGQGYSCAEAENGKEAVEIARQCPPWLVLLDLMMPEVDGFTVAEQLRADPHTSDIPIYCLTGLDFPAAHRAAQRSGCEVILTKPLDLEGLLDVVSVALSPGQNVHAADV